MRAVKGLGIGLLTGLVALLGVGLIADMAQMDPDAANKLQGLAFPVGFALGVVAALRDSKPKPPRLTVRPEDWGKPRAK